MTAYAPISGQGVIFLSGPHLSGKGTLARALTENARIPEGNLISIGGTLRAIKEQIVTDPDAVERAWGISQTKRISCDIEPELERMAQDHDTSAMTEQEWFAFCLDSGALLPTPWLMAIFTHSLDSIEDTSQPIILDGVPRRLTEAQAIFSLLAERNIPILHLFEFVFREGDQDLKGQEHEGNIESLLTRAGNRERADDDPESIRRRYRFYLDNIVPTLHWMHRVIGSPDHITQLPMSSTKNETRNRALSALVGVEPIPIRPEAVAAATAAERAPAP